MFFQTLPNDDVTINIKAPPGASKNIKKYRRSYKSYIRNRCRPEMTRHRNDLKENYTSLVKNSKEFFSSIFH